MPEQRSYKIIACDLDETLLGPDRLVSPGNREAIREATARGVKFVPATGRGFPSVQGTLKEIGLWGAAGEYVLSYNGGAITENHGNRLIDFHGLTFAQARTLFERGLTYNVCMHVYTLDTVYVHNLPPDEKAYISGRMEVVDLPSPSIDFLRDVPIGKVLYGSTDLEYLGKIERELADCTGEMEISYSSSRYLEFNPRGVSKGSGLLRLAELLGADPRDTIAIGDNINDLSMIRAAGLGVGVRNSVEEIKPDCDYVTEAPYDQDAVAEVIRKFVLGKEG